MLHSENAPTNPEVTPPPPPMELGATVYAQLHRLAACELTRERPGHTLTPTALVHEAYLRLAQQAASSFPSRAEFCGAFAVTFRRVLVDHARRRNRKKRGGKDQRRIQLDTSLLFQSQIPADILDLDEALRLLEEVSPDRARVVEVRYFGGLTEAETAEHLGLSRTTVQKLWRSARAWLRAHLMRG